jgi:hypothetical protein
VLLYSTHQVIGDVRLEIVGLIWRSPKDWIERRTPSKSKNQNRYRYIHNEESLHTENNEKTSSFLPSLEREIVHFLKLIKVVNSS